MKLRSETKSNTPDYGFQTKQYKELQHKVEVSLSIEPYPVHDGKIQGSDTTPLDHSKSKQNICRNINSYF